MSWNDSSGVLKAEGLSGRMVRLSTTVRELSLDW